MTVWELAACVDGWNRVHGGGAQADALKPDEFDGMLERYAEAQLATVH